MSNQLDATNIKGKGASLVKAITDVIGDTQNFILTPLPDSLLLTRPQFDSITDFLAHASDYSLISNRIAISEDRLLQTKWNVMDIEVKG